VVVVVEKKGGGGGGGGDGEVRGEVEEEIGAGKIQKNSAKLLWRMDSQCATKNNRFFYFAGKNL
jgi:hypothetical protein